MKMRKDQLTERQKVFCQHYVGQAQHNSALAARLAGYAASCSHVTGCQLLQKPKIAATVRGLEAAVAVEMGYTRDRVIRELVGAFEMAKVMRNPASMVASMRQVGLMCGYYRQESEGIGASVEAGAADGADMALLQRMSDAELMAIIDGGAGVS